MANNYIKKRSEISIITPLFTSLLLYEKLIKSNHMFMNWIAHQGYALVFSSVTCSKRISKSYCKSLIEYVVVRQKFSSIRPSELGV